MNYPDFSYEKELTVQGYSLIAGVDEAGRGPLAGDVYAAAVILPAVFAGKVNDSKLLAPGAREKLFSEITENAIAFAVAAATVAEIEELNILSATMLAMNRAVEALSPCSDFAIVDGNRGAGLSFPHMLLVKGDQISMSVAAASILAKVSRDRYMLQLDALYPEYGFSRNKGYGTKDHIEALKNYGSTPVHRKLFIRKFPREFT